MATETKTADRPAAAVAAGRRAAHLLRDPRPPLLPPRDMAGIPYPEKLGDPGQYPLYPRPLSRTCTASATGPCASTPGYSSAAESNKRYRYLLVAGDDRGSRSPSTCRPRSATTRTTPWPAARWGASGWPSTRSTDMRLLFDGIPLDRVTTSMTINATAAILLALYLAVAEEQGVAWEKVGGTVQNDILKEYAARGTYIYPPRPSLKLVTDIIAFCAERVPKWNTISISGYHMREAGSTAVQEVAFTLANGLAYVQAALDRGLDVDDFAPRLSFFFNAHNNFLEEVAKFRAARRLWAELVRERFGAKDPRSLWLRFHTQTAGSTLTAQQPQNNVVRVAIQALAAVCGGTQSLHTNSLDEALGLPTEEAARARAAHPAGDRQRERRGRRRRSARRLATSSRRGRRRSCERLARLHPPHRRDGRRAGRPSSGGSSRRRSPTRPTATRWRSRRSGRSWWG